jgi:hypothetical protein
MDKAFEAFNITNYREHPDNPRYMVFFFKKEHEAAYFEQRLKDEGFWYERDITERKDGSPLHLFGVKRLDYEAVLKINFDTSGRFRGRSIPGKWTGIVILTITLAMVVIGLLGYFGRT